MSPPCAFETILFDGSQGEMTVYSDPEDLICAHCRRAIWDTRRKIDTSGTVEYHGVKIF